MKRFVDTMNTRCVHLAKSLTKALHVCGNLLFVEKVILMNGTKKNVCMEIAQIVVSRSCIFV